MAGKGISGMAGKGISGMAGKGNFWNGWKGNFWLDCIALEKNRALCVEVLCLAANLMHGGQVCRPLSDDAVTGPKGDQVKLDWFPCSKSLAPACRLEPCRGA
eukprot:5868376-Amphidinium_carterae.2